MKRSLISIAILSAFLVVAPCADAQRPGGERPGGERPGGGRPGGGGRFGGFRGGQSDAFSLAGIEQVQKEIGLEGENLESVKKMIESSRSAGRELMTGFGNFREMSDEERTKAFAELSEKREAMQKENAGKLAKLLTAEQMTRLDQIALQQKGLRALEDEAIAAKLELTVEQQLEIVDLNEEMRQSQRKLMEEVRSAGREGFAQMREKVETLRETSDEKLMAVMNDAQKAKFDELKGKPFELDRRAMFSGRGQDRRRGNRDGDRGGDNNRRQRPETE